MLFKSLSGKSRFMKRLFCLTLLSLAFVLPVDLLYADQQGQVYGWGVSKLLNGETLTNISKIAAGRYYSLALKSDGSIVGWGSNICDEEHSGQATPPSGNDFITIAAGDFHGLALKSDGSIVGWGDNTYGQATSPNGNYLAITAGIWHSLALKANGSIVGWGKDNYGQATPPTGTDFVAIAAGGSHSLALKADGSIVGWGLDSVGQATPPDGNDFIAIAAGSSHSLALKSDGSIVGWGYDYYGQATPPDGNDFIAIAAGGSHNLALKSDGSIVGWGRNSEGQATPPEGDYLAIAAGVLHSLALKSDGSIIGWGWNAYGQVAPPQENNFIAIAVGSSHSLALKSDGSIFGWGYDYFGQATPPDGNDFIAVAVGHSHSLALKSDGSIVGWGYDSDGQATSPDGNDFIAIAAGGDYSLALKSDSSIIAWGNNSYSQCDVPLPNEGFTTIIAGDYHSLALKSDGSIIGWGNNNYGQATPPAGNDFIAIAAGFRHSLALKSDGFIVGWGWDDYGQATPPDSNDFIAIAAGVYHSLALKSNGSIVGWGRDNYGQATPPANTGFIAIAAGGSQSLALLPAFPIQPIQVSIDIKPHTCPNRLNINSKGLLTVAIVGTEELDVYEIDPASVSLNGVSATHSRYDDILTSAESCTCEGAVGPDGYPELIVKFEIKAILETLGGISDSDEVELLLTGVLEDERPIEGTDCVLITFPGQETEVPDGMVWVYIDDPGVPDHEGFTGEMSKYETTNAQYCQFLNAALASGDITVSDNRVYGADGSNGGADFVGQVYFDTSNYTSWSQITWDGTSFSVRSRDGYDMSNHPVVEVSWYGATAFCNYYGYRLPTQWEWQAVADYDGSYIYGCGITIDHSKANYYLYNPLGLSSSPYTSPVDYYPAYGYGMNDMAGNVAEWTDSISGSYCIFRGGSWGSTDYVCTVSLRFANDPLDTYNGVGFRVCR